MKHLLGAIVVVACLGGCSAAKTEQAQAESLAKEAAHRFGGYADTLAVADQAGSDYLDVVGRCLARDPEAMGELLRLTEEAGFDASSAQGHSDVLGFVLRDVGERMFAACLACQSRPVQAAVREFLLFEFGLGEDPTLTMAELRSLYPRIFPADFDPES